MAQIRQSRPDYGLGLQITVLKTTLKVKANRPLHHLTSGVSALFRTFIRVIKKRKKKRKKKGRAEGGGLSLGRAEWFSA